MMCPSTGALQLIIFASCVIGLSGVLANVQVQIQGLGYVEGTVARTARTRQQMYQFYNIPYAEAPIGQRRFKAPVPMTPWLGVIDATIPRRACPQLDTTDFENAEDCLSLSVFTKNLTSRFAVMVYIHGGSFWIGSAARHPPDYLLEKDVVLVVIQYRLNAFGFLSTMSTAIPGNAGMLDMIEALNWIQSHISDFGGDNQRVTLFGQSAGAAAISAMLYSPIVPDNYFQQVILQSGSSISPWAIDSHPVSNALQIANLAGCNINSTAHPSLDINDCLKNLPTKVLLKASVDYTAETMESLGFNVAELNSMVVGGPSGFLDESPIQSMRANRIRKNVRMMAGVTRDEGTAIAQFIYGLLKDANRTVDHKKKNFVSDLLETVNRVIGMDDSTGALVGYEMSSLFSEDEIRSGNFSRLVDGLIDLIGTGNFKSPVLRDVHTNFKHGAGPTYLYTFDYRGEHTRFLYEQQNSFNLFNGRVQHSDECIYLFPYPKEKSQLNSADTRMSKIMVDLWTSFAINGVPSSPDMPDWPVVDSITGPYLHIDDPGHIGTNFYDEFRATTRHSKKRIKYRLSLCDNEE